MEALATGWKQAADIDTFVKVYRTLVDLMVGVNGYMLASKVSRTGNVGDHVFTRLTAQLAHLGVLKDWGWDG